MSDGCVATQCSECPRIAWLRCSPSRAAQPEPGSRLLHGVVTSWKYAQRVRCSRLPPVVAMLRSCPDAPASSACGEHRVARRGRAGSAARSLLRTPAPIRRPPSSGSLDSVERQARDVDEQRRLLDAEPHQVDEVRAAAEERAPGARRAARRRRPRRVGARVANGLTATPPRSRRRCSGRRRSGRGCRSSARGSPPASSRGSARRSAVTRARPPRSTSSSMPTAEQIWPGVQ